MDAESFRSASKITAAWVAVYAASMFKQIFDKTKVTVEAVNAKDKMFNRYTDSRLIVADRIVGNTLEWGAIFLPSLWIAFGLAQDNENVSWWGWLYIATRAIYPILASLGGLRRSGAQPLIFLATVPGYAALMALGYKNYKALM
jgi:hypothetical protein